MGLTFPLRVSLDTSSRGVATLGSSGHVPISLSVVSFLEIPKTDHDEMAALYLNAILKFDFIIVLLVAEHILSSTVALTNYLQKRDIDLRSSRSWAQLNY